jgi:DNA-directed RNA polymerase subunit L
MQNGSGIDAVDFNPAHFNDKGKMTIKSVDEMVRMQCLVDNIQSILNTDEELAKIAKTWGSLEMHLLQKECKLLNQYSSLCYDYTKRKCLSQTKQSEDALKEERNEGSKMVMQLKAMHEIKTQLTEGRFDNKFGDTR